MKVVFNIEKRYVYVITGLIMLVAGLLIVNAYANSAGVGHDPGEIGPGAFATSDQYSFRGPIAIGIDQGQSGTIFMYSADNSQTKGYAIDNGDGSFRIYNSQGTMLSIAPNGDIATKVDAGITLGGVRRTSWPNTGITQAWTTTCRNVGPTNDAPETARWAVCSQDEFVNAVKCEETGETGECDAISIKCCKFNSA